MNNKLLFLLLATSSFLGLSAQNLTPDKFRDNYVYPEGQEKLEDVIAEGALFPSVGDPVNITADGRKVWYMFDIEGNDYLVAEFNNTSTGGYDAGIWMTQNLRTQTYPDGSSIPYNGSAGNTDASYGHPGIGSMQEPFYRWEKEQGLFYTWVAATKGDNPSAIDQGWGNESSENPFTKSLGADEVEGATGTGKIQGVCPKGWHLPSDREWSQLIYVIRQNATAYGIKGNQPEAMPSPSGTPPLVPTNDIGTVLKSATTLTDNTWSASTGLSLSSWQGGVNLLLVGLARNGSAYDYGSGGYLWSSSSTNGSDAWYRRVLSANAGVDRYTSDRYNLFSVRCKKD